MDYAVLSVQLTPYTEPYYFNIKRDFNTTELFSQILSVFGYSADTNAVLTKTDNPENKYSFMKDNGFEVKLNGSFYVSFETNCLQTQEFYDSFLKFNENDSTESFSLSEMIKEHYKSYNLAYTMLFKNSFLQLALNDIIDKKYNLLTSNITSWIHIYDVNEVFSSFSELISTRVADKICWFDFSSQSSPKYDAEVLDSLLKLLLSIVVKHSYLRKAPRMIFNLYKSTRFFYLLLSHIVHIVVDHNSKSESYVILTALFKPKWIWKCMDMCGSIEKFLDDDSMISNFPFIFAKIIFGKTFSHVLRPFETIEILQSSISNHLFISLGFIDTLVSSLMSRIYEINTNNPGLLMKKEFVESINELICYSLPILYEYVTPYEQTQVFCLNQVHRIISRQGYLPKGLLHCVFSAMFFNNVIHKSTLSKWMMNPICRTNDKESALLEIANSLLYHMPPSFDD